MDKLGVKNDEELKALIERLKKEQEEKTDAPPSVKPEPGVSVKRPLGLEVTSEKVEGRGRVYRLPADSPV
jgi:hypothetical protein